MVETSQLELERISKLLLPADEAGDKKTQDIEVSQIIQHAAKADFKAVLESQYARRLLGHEETESLPNVAVEGKDYPRGLADRISSILRSDEDFSEASPKFPPRRAKLQLAFLVGYSVLHAFLQSNITGPPLNFDSAQIVFPKHLNANEAFVKEARAAIVSALSVDGIAPYALIPNVELFFVARVVSDEIESSLAGAIPQRIHVNFLHQRLLTEESSSLQSSVETDLDLIDTKSLSTGDHLNYLLQKTAINIYYGSDSKARQLLDESSRISGFQFALTGRLGKRTKFQQTDLSQLVVLAKSASEENGDSARTHVQRNKPDSKPTNLDLNDDTLLESISFTPASEANSTSIKDEGSLPPGLVSLDPGDQPPLKPVDAIILLLLASSITNTSPDHGLTREETLPYAARVLEGGSTNWQVYTQALLVRSRIEGYRSRTVERGLLQLQALVDQVIAETSGSSDATENAANSTSTFLPRGKQSESAPVTERLRYIHQLSSPTRWELEAELASRWISLGGLKTALDIYERLEMWAEVALCLGGLDDESKARRVARKQLFHPSRGQDVEVDEDEEKWEGPERNPPPPGAARYYCILGDIDQDPSMYEKAWEVSGGRYARAQRSLGKLYFASKQFDKSAEAYAKSLKINQLNHSSWYALGCARLQLEQWNGAVEAFARAVQLDESDAESWSNLAAALLEQGPPAVSTDGEEGEQKTDPQKHFKDALKALKQASKLKHDDWRIWENILTVSASMAPPPYAEVVVAMRRVIQIRSPSMGEKAVDEDVLDLLVRYLVMSSEEHDASQPGLPRMICDLVDNEVLPLITKSRRLWQIVARLQLWRKKPAAALESHGKAWRAETSRTGWDSGENEALWNDVVDATIELVDSYQSLGQMELPETNTLVAKDWKFKARTAVRGIMGRGKDYWEGTDGWERLAQSLEEMRS